MPGMYQGPYPYEIIRTPTGLRVRPIRRESMSIITVQTFPGPVPPPPPMMVEIVMPRGDATRLMRILGNISGAGPTSSKFRATVDALHEAMSAAGIDAAVPNYEDQKLLLRLR